MWSLTIFLIYGFTLASRTVAWELPSMPKLNIPGLGGGAQPEGVVTSTMGPTEYPTSVSTAAPGAGDASTPALRTQALQQLNHVRATKNAADMRCLAWHPELATAARTVARQCNLEARYQDANTFCFISVGETVFIPSSSSIRDETQLIQEMVAAFTAGEQTFIAGPNRCPADNPNCRFYLQMVWANSADIGCAVEQCPNPAEPGGESLSVIACLYGNREKVTTAEVTLPFDATRAAATCCPRWPGWRDTPSGEAGKYCCSAPSVPEPASQCSLHESHDVRGELNAHACEVFGSSTTGAPATGSTGSPATGSTALITGSTGFATGSTKLATGSTGLFTGSTGLFTGSTGAPFSGSTKSATGSTMLITGSTGSATPKLTTNAPTGSTATAVTVSSATGSTAIAASFSTKTPTGSTGPMVTPTTGISRTTGIFTMTSPQTMTSAAFTTASPNTITVTGSTRLPIFSSTIAQTPSSPATFSTPLPNTASAPTSAPVLTATGSQPTSQATATISTAAFTASSGRTLEATSQTTPATLSVPWGTSAQTPGHTELTQAPVTTAVPVTLPTEASPLHPTAPQTTLHPDVPVVATNPPLTTQAPIQLPTQPITVPPLTPPLTPPPPFIPTVPLPPGVTWPPVPTVPIAPAVTLPPVIPITQPTIAPVTQPVIVPVTQPTVAPITPPRPFVYPTQPPFIPFTQGKPLWPPPPVVRITPAAVAPKQTQPTIRPYIGWQPPTQFRPIQATQRPIIPPRFPVLVGVTQAPWIQPTPPVYFPPNVTPWLGYPLPTLPGGQLIFPGFTQRVPIWFPVVTPAPVFRWPPGVTAGPFQPQQTRGTWPPGVTFTIRPMPDCDTSQCVDLEPENCKVYQQSKGCDRNPIIAYKKCRQTCGNCGCNVCRDSPIPKLCSKVEYCAVGAVQDYCPRLCGRCHVGVASGYDHRYATAAPLQPIQNRKLARNGGVNEKKIESKSKHGAIDLRRDNAKLHLSEKGHAQSVKGMDKRKHKSSNGAFSRTGRLDLHNEQQQHSQQQQLQQHRNATTSARNSTSNSTNHTTIHGHSANNDTHHRAAKHPAANVVRGTVRSQHPRGATVSWHGHMTIKPQMPKGGSHNDGIIHGPHHHASQLNSHSLLVQKAKANGNVALIGHSNAPFIFHRGQFQTQRPINLINSKTGMPNHNNHHATQHYTRQPHAPPNNRSKPAEQKGIPAHQPQQQLLQQHLAPTHSQSLQEQVLLPQHQAHLQKHAAVSNQHDMHLATAAGHVTRQPHALNNISKPLESHKGIRIHQPQQQLLQQHPQPLPQQVLYQHQQQQLQQRQSQHQQHHLPGALDAHNERMPAATSASRTQTATPKVAGLIHQSKQPVFDKEHHRVAGPNDLEHHSHRTAKPVPHLQDPNSAAKSQTVGHLATLPNHNDDTSHQLDEQDNLHHPPQAHHRQPAHHQEAHQQITQAHLSPLPQANFVSLQQLPPGENNHTCVDADPSACQSMIPDQCNRKPGKYHLKLCRKTCNNCTDPCRDATSFSCAALKPYCATLLSAQEHCPKTCGICLLNSRDPSHGPEKNMKN